MGGGSNRPSLRPPVGGDFDGDDGDDDFEGELFGPSSGGTKPKPPRPERPRPSKPSGGGSYKPDFGSNTDLERPSEPSKPSGSYKPDFGGDTGDDGTYIPPGDVNQDDGSYKPGLDESGLGLGTF